MRFLTSSLKPYCPIRRTMGADIAGACGQLVVEQEMQMLKLMDIEDGPVSTSTSKKPKVFVVGNKKRDTEGKRENRIIRHLMIATGIATSCFFISGVLFVMQRRKR